MNFKKYERTLGQLERIEKSIPGVFNKKNPYEVDIEYMIENDFGLTIEPAALKIAVPTVEAFPCIDKNKIYVDIRI